MERAACEGRGGPEESHREKQGREPPAKTAGSGLLDRKTCLQPRSLLHGGLLEGQRLRPSPTGPSCLGACDAADTRHPRAESNPAQRKRTRASGLDARAECPQEDRHHAILSYRGCETPTQSIPNQRPTRNGFVGGIGSIPLCLGSGLTPRSASPQLDPSRASKPSRQLLRPRPVAPSWCRT